MTRNDSWLDWVIVIVLICRRRKIIWNHLKIIWKSFETILKRRIFLIFFIFWYGGNQDWMAVRVASQHRGIAAFTDWTGVDRSSAGRVYHDGRSTIPPSAQSRIGFKWRPNQYENHHRRPVQRLQSLRDHFWRVPGFIDTDGHQFYLPQLNQMKSWRQNIVGSTLRSWFRSLRASHTGRSYGSIQKVG